MPNLQNHKVPEVQENLNNLCEDLRLYVGKNVGAYERLIDLYGPETASSRVGFKPSFVLSGLLAPPIWLLYRKMNGLAFLTFCIFEVTYLGNISPYVWLGVSLVTAIAGKTHYIRKSANEIRAIRLYAESPEHAREMIQTFGGVKPLQTGFIVAGIVGLQLAFAIFLALNK